MLEEGKFMEITWNITTTLSSNFSRFSQAFFAQKSTFPIGVLYQCVMYGYVISVYCRYEFYLGGRIIHKQKQKKSNTIKIIYIYILLDN